MNEALEDMLLSIVDNMENGGVNFSEEVGRVSFEIPSREDLHVEMYIVDKAVHEEFNKHEIYTYDTM